MRRFWLTYLNSVEGVCFVLENHTLPTMHLTIETITTTIQDLRTCATAPPTYTKPSVISPSFQPNELVKNTGPFLQPVCFRLVTL
jgi:hypothetical protein